MNLNHLEQHATLRAKRRAKKLTPTMRMSGKRTREVPKLWKKRASG